MLILTRKVGETLVIDGNVKVVIMGVEGKNIRIGVDAPRVVTVHREEIQKRIDNGEPDKKFLREADDDWT